MGALESAQAEVALKYDPQQSNIQRQLDSLKASTAANETGLQQFGTAGRTGINDVYNTLNSLLTGNRATSAQEQATAGQNIGNVYDNGAAYQSAVANASRSRLAAMAQQVGAGAAGELQVLQPFEQDQSGYQGAIQLAKANALENQKGWANRWDQILGNGINIGEQTRATKLSDFETELLNLLGTNKVKGLEGENEMYGKLGDIMSARQNDLVASFERLQQQEWERSFQQAQLDQDAASKNASLAMQKYGIDAQSADAAASRAAAGQLTEKDLAMLAQQAGQDAESKRRFDLEFGLKQGDYNQGLQAYQDSQTAARYAPGQQALASYMTTNANDLSHVNSFIDNLQRSGFPTQAGEARAPFVDFFQNRPAASSSSKSKVYSNSGYATPSGQTSGLGWYGFSG